ATGDADELVSTVQGVVPTFEAKRDAVTEVLALLGARFFDPTGRALVDALAQAGFVTVQGVPDTDWPASDASVVVLSPSGGAAERAALRGADVRPFDG